MAIPRLFERLYHSIAWHRADQITPAFERRVARTLPVPCDPRAPVEVHSLVDHHRLWTWLLGIKTLLKHVPGLHVVLHDDGSLTAADRADAQHHVPGLRIINRVDADERMAESLAAYPACRTFRDNNIVMAQVFDFPVLAETEKLISFDSDILIHSCPGEVAAWATTDSDDVLYEEATSPFCPRIDGVDITTLPDVPFQFAPNLCGGFVCGFRSMYELPQTESYCEYVLANCHDRLYRAQTITAMSIAHSACTPKTLPGTYQNLHTFAEDPVMRHYYFSGLPPTDFLKDARELLRSLA